MQDLLSFKYKKSKKIMIQEQTRTIETIFIKKPLLRGWFRIVMLLLIWLLAVLGVCLSFFTLKLPRWVLASLYVGMGWVAILALPVFITKLPWTALATLALGGILYTIGAVIYARKKPDPVPHILGFHEIFHLFVIAGSVAFAACIWIWALPFPRM